MSETLVLKVNGMSCQHCVMAVKKAVNPIAGVEAVEVDLKAGTVTVKGIGVSRESVSNAITEAGYEVA